MHLQAITLVFEGKMKSPLTVSSQRPCRGILPDLAAWQSVTLLAMCFHPKRRTAIPRILSTCTRADATATKKWRLRREVKWQIQVARRNINSFRTSEQQVGCQGERSKGLTPDMTDALETRARQLILCVSVWVSVCLYSEAYPLCVQSVRWLDSPLCFKLTKKHVNTVRSMCTVSSFKIKTTQ